MEKGAKALFYILIFALVVGGLLTLFHPLYRGSWQALWNGRPEDSPIWKSNARFYTEIQLDDTREGPRDAK